MHKRTFKITDEFWKGREAGRIAYDRLLDDLVVLLEEQTFWGRIYLLLLLMSFIPLLAISVLEYNNLLYPNAVSHAVTTWMFISALSFSSMTKRETATAASTDISQSLYEKSMADSIRVSTYINLPLEEILAKDYKMTGGLLKEVMELRHNMSKESQE
jgi:hypothetical protein